MAVDQAHNAVVKCDGGAVGLTEDPAALRGWMVVGIEICRLVIEFESSLDQAPIVSVKNISHGPKIFLE